MKQKYIKLNQDLEKFVADLKTEQKDVNNGALESAVNRKMYPSLDAYNMKIEKIQTYKKCSYAILDSLILRCENLLKANS